MEKLLTAKAFVDRLATVGTKKELNVSEPILNIDKEDLCAYCILS